LQLPAGDTRSVAQFAQRGEGVRHPRRPPPRAV
jgi:hypothetical protein